MTLTELADILNPETKFGRDINWAISDSAWYVGGNKNRRDTTLKHIKQNNRGTILQYFQWSNSNNSGWSTVGFLELSEDHIASLNLYSDSNVKLLNDLKKKLPEEITLKIVDRK